jgi:formamidopyrimidine-DNA glycosylase
MKSAQIDIININETMPELPDVENFRKYFDRTSLRQRIQTVELRAPEMLRGISQRKLIGELESHQFVSSSRHGKYLFAELDTGSFLILHFGMTGELKYFKNAADGPLYIRLLIEFTNGYHLAFDCQRKLGKISFIRDRVSFIRKKSLGPDILAEDFDFAAFQKILSQKKGRIKSILMNQRIFAGIGNLYADEILFQSRIHPASRLDQLSNRRKRRLFEAMKIVLSTAIKSNVHARKLTSHFLLTNRSKDAKCPLCGKILRRMKVAGRTSYYCPKHQKTERPSALFHGRGGREDGDNY